MSLQNILPAQKKEEMWLSERESKTMRSSADAANRSGTVSCAPRMMPRPHMDPLSSAPDLNAFAVSAYEQPHLHVCIDVIERRERGKEASSILSETGWQCCCGSTQKTVSGKGVCDRVGRGWFAGGPGELINIHDRKATKCKA